MRRFALSNAQYAKVLDFVLEDREILSFDEKDSNAASMRRLQLRLALMMMHRQNWPSCQNWTKPSRFDKDIKTTAFDLNSGVDMPPVPGSSDIGSHNMVPLFLGPDVRRVFVLFGAIRHQRPLLCCYSALGGLICDGNHCAEGTPRWKS